MQNRAFVTPYAYLSKPSVQNLEARAENARHLVDRLTRLREKTKRHPYEKGDALEMAAIIKEMRDKLNTPYVEVAYYAGVHPNLVSSFVSAKAKGKPRFENFAAILKASMALCGERAVSATPGDSSLPAIGSSMIWVAEWTSLDPKGVQRQLSKLSNTLEGLVLLARGANSADGDGASLLSLMQRQQLISILETALTIVKAPMVEVGLLRRLGNWLKAIATKSAESHLEEAMGSAASHGAELLEEFVDSVI